MIVSPANKGRTKEEIRMITLALCMIVRDEEKVIGRCLQSVKDVCDEIIVVDTGSRDKTREIAADCGAKVYSFPWNYDFSAARNYSFSLAASDYIMWLDADDVLTDENREKLRNFKAAAGGGVDAYYLRYDAAFDEQGNTTFFFYRERILRRASRPLWQGAVHEAICVNGTRKYLDIAIKHLRGEKTRGRNLFIFAYNFAHGRMPDERQKYYFARELSDNGLYDTAASVFENFLQGKGCAADKTDACRALAFCYKQQGKRSQQLSALLRSVEFAPPRAELCCDTGAFFVEEERWDQAIFWYKLALLTEEKTGFVCPDCSGFLPCIWLCVCYDRLGDHKKAKEYNDRAGMYKPQDKSYLHNKKYFDDLYYKGEIE